MTTIAFFPVHECLTNFAVRKCSTLSNSVFASVNARKLIAPLHFTRFDHFIFTLDLAWSSHNSARPVERLNFGLINVHFIN